MKLKTNILKHTMIDKEMKLRQLQEVTGVSRQTLSAVNNGKSCSRATAEKIAEALKMSVTELIETEV